MDIVDASERACLLVERAGFVLLHRSKKSEARYYGLPGRDGLLRVAAHASKVAMIDNIKILSRLTFLYANPREQSRQCLSLTMDMLEAQTAAAIGRYMIASGSAIEGPTPDSTPQPI
jgi:hypothetical protein